MKSLYAKLIYKNVCIFTFVAFLFNFNVVAQTLTTQNGGQTGTSGTNWSISGTTLTVTGTASIDASTVETALGNGSLTIVGNTTDFDVTISESIISSTAGNGLTIGNDGDTGQIRINQSVTIAGAITFNGGYVYTLADVESTQSGADIILKASENVPGSNLSNGWIIFTNLVDVTTTNSDIIIWSNAANRTSGQANNEVVLQGNNILSTSGGKIVIAGGLDDGSNGGTAADGIPDGYAYRGSYTGEAVDIRANVTIDSDGGEIIIRGQQNGADTAVRSDNTFNINNAGAVTIDGKNTGIYSVLFGIANLNVSNANASLTLNGTTSIAALGLLTVTTQGGDVLFASNVDDATDGETTVNGFIRMNAGLSITTNGGDITLGGENASATGYAMGSSNGSLTEGIRVDVSNNLNSGGGSISLKGKSYAASVGAATGAAGVMFFNVISGVVNSGTGTILLDGYSQTSAGNAIAGILWWNNSTASDFTIQSANTNANALPSTAFLQASQGKLMV